MAGKPNAFISEIFWTTDHKFAFQKVGVYYNLYDEMSEWHFTKEFRSFEAMQNFMNEMRNKSAKENERCTTESSTEI